VDRRRKNSSVARRAAVPANGSSRHNGRGKVAVLDADRDVRRAFARLLRTEHYSVRTFRSLDEFLASCFPSRADCLVLDVRLRNGREREQLALFEYPPMIFVTADEDDAATVRDLKSGQRVVCLPKPCEDTELLSAVAEGMTR